MNRILIAATALSLLGASVASAQPYGGYQGQDNGYRQDHGDRHDGERRGDAYQHGRDWRDGGQRHDWRGRHGGYRVCRWRHHHRVCYR